MAQLAAWLDSGALAREKLERVEREFLAIRRGEAQEKDAAYHLDFRFRDTRNWMVIHDLRLEINGRVARIDHVLINRFLEVYVLESKYFRGNVVINEHGEFTVWYGKRAFGIPSPIEQNRRHVAVMRDFLDGLPLPTLMGVRKEALIKPFVLVSPNATIRRPLGTHDVFDDIVKCDAFVSRIESEIDAASPLYALKAVARMVSQDDLYAIGRLMVLAHEPITFDHAAKFGLEPSPSNPIQDAPRAQGAPVPERRCPKCASALVKRVAKKGANEGVEFWGCGAFPKCWYRET